MSKIKSSDTDKGAGKDASKDLIGVDVNFIGGSVVFEDMAPIQTINLLASLGATTQVYSDGEVVIRAGSDLDVYPIVVYGAVKATIEQDGVERTVAQFEAGDSFAEAAAMSLGFCPASVWAQGDTCVLSIPAIALSASNDPLAVQLLRNISVQMSGKVKTLVSYISVIGEPRLEQRIFAYLDKLPRRDDGYVVLPISQHSWADMLRVDEKSLSRKLRGMRTDGLLEIMRTNEGTLLRRPEWSKSDKEVDDDLTTSATDAPDADDSTQ